jgi:hypothetical protein
VGYAITALLSKENYSLPPSHIKGLRQAINVFLALHQVYEANLSNTHSSLAAVFASAN